jgi:MFS transporter, putative metabolite:H+ symporter
MQPNKNNIALWVSVIAVTFGYFVDLYDLMLFSSVRGASLKEIGITGEDATRYAQSLMNITVLGMFIGGFVWGAIADKRGRLTVLFASILTYSIANFVNAFVQNIWVYEACRFVAGFGLAGELGVGITLISELLPSEKRTTATTLISGLGMLGAATAGALTYFLGGIQILGFSSWRFLFFLGGLLGLAVLIFRVTTVESKVFKKSEPQKYLEILSLLLTDKRRLLKFACCFGVGAPIFFIIGNFITLSPEYGKLSGANSVQASLAVLYCYVSIAISTTIGTYLSKIFKSRIKIIFGFMLIQTISILAYLYIPTPSSGLFYLKVVFLGIGIGNWGLIVVNSAEQFGTNLRATVTTSVPNIIRALLVIQTYLMFNPLKPYFGLINSALIVSVISLVAAFFSISRLKDNFEGNIDFRETI